MTKPDNYGSIEEGGDNTSFDATQMAYLGQGKPLSREEKLRKLMRMAVPLFLAAVTLGAAVKFLLGDFGNLYPGGSGSGHSSKASIQDSSPAYAPSATTTTTTTTMASSSSHIPTSKLDPKCEAHEACTGLIGSCCPTNDGFFLDCCN